MPPKFEIALRRVLKDEGATAFTTNFDDLGDANINDPNFVGFDQIPGLASQRLMAEGIGFGAEGDWKTACLYRTLWVIQQGMPTGCSFLEDYTLNFAGDRRLLSAEPHAGSMSADCSRQTQTRGSLPRNWYP